MSDERRTGYVDQVMAYTTPGGSGIGYRSLAEMAVDALASELAEVDRLREERKELRADLSDLHNAMDDTCDALNLEVQAWETCAISLAGLLRAAIDRCERDGVAFRADNPDWQGRPFTPDSKPVPGEWVITERCDDCLAAVALLDRIGATEGGEGA